MKMCISEIRQKTFAFSRALERAAMLMCIVAIQAYGQGTAYTQPLATGVRLDPVGDAIEVGSMPIGMAVAPGGRQVALVLSGWREQGLQIVDLNSRRVTQTLPQDSAFLGVAFSHDGKKLCASGGNDDAIWCYSWQDGVAKFERKIALAEKEKGKLGTRYPAGLAVSRAGSYLYTAENVGDDLAVVDLATSKIVQRLPTDHYPYAVEVAANGKVYVSAWAADTISEFSTTNDGQLKLAGKLKVGPRPSALLSNRSGSRLYAALGGVDQIAVVDTQQNKVIRKLTDAAPAGPSQGSTPNALALSEDESKLFVAEADNNAVAVFDVSEKGADVRASQPLGRVPTDWYPTALAVSAGELIVVNGKGHGSHSNPDGPMPGEGIKRPFGYDLGQLNGTIRLSPERISSQRLKEYSQRSAQANNWTAPRTSKKYPPFKHVVYIIKENRTYDQVLGDLKEGDGDPSLVFFGKDVAPNHRALALRFGLFDRFFTNAEVSSQGHIWSTAAYVTDFGEKTIPSGYSDRREGIDGEESR
jgi:DNA-binding beta-propeller fold protein YncE